MAFRLSSAAAERCSGRGIAPPTTSARPVLRAGRSFVGTRLNLTAVHRYNGLHTQHRPVSIQSASTSVPLGYPSPVLSAQTPGSSAKLTEHLPILKTFAVVAACFAVCSFVSAAFPTAGPCLASVSFSAVEAAKGTHLVAAKSAWAGLAAGFLHTLCGPDHLAALTPLTIGRDRTSATLLGALWGFGHSTGQLILGLFFVLLKERFNNFLPALSKWGGVIVGLTLLAIGFMGIYETVFEHGGDEEEAAVAMAGVDGSSGSAATQKAKFGLATYATGIVYGLQPDALFVVIPALALPTKMAAIAYCSMFVVGTVTAMGGYTLLIGTTSQAIIKQKPWLQAHLSTIASAVAILVGSLVLAAGLGFNVPFFS